MFTSLRNVLLIDAATCLVAGAVMALGAAPIAGLTALPQPLLLYAGVALLPIAAFMALTATRSPIPRAPVWLIVAGNAAWVIASIAVMILAGPNVLGHAFVAAQALVVAVLTKLEYEGAQAATAAA